MPTDRDEYARRLGELLLTEDESASMKAPGGVAAAVLIPLYLSNGDLHAVFTKRNADLRRHAGEISFPGGREDDTDHDLVHTALREAEEEIGLPIDAVEVLGALQPTPTIATSYAIYPFVGWIEAGREWELSPREVAAVHEFSLADLRAGYGRQRLIRRGVPFRTDVYVVGDDLIWGATARILGDLLERVEGREELPWTA